MSYQDWLQCFRFENDDVIMKACPCCKKKLIKFQFVGDKSTRFGSLFIWCDSCKNGIHVSSVQLPSNADVIPYNAFEELKNRIPEYKLIHD